MKVYVVRHGDRAAGDYYNTGLRHQDSPISETGIGKAKELASYFKDISIQKIIASEYLRTRETAEFTAAEKGLQIIMDRRLNEIDNGVIEALSDEEIETMYPEFWHDFLEGAKDVRFPEGETGEEVRARQRELLEELVQNGENALLVSHEGYMRLLMCNLLGMPVYKRRMFKVDFCGIIEFEFDKDVKEWRVIRFNQTP